MSKPQRAQQWRIDEATVEVVAAWKIHRQNPTHDASLTLRYRLAQLTRTVEKHAPEILAEKGEAK